MQLATKSIFQPLYISLLIVLLSHLAAFYPVWVKLITIWSRSDDYSHGFLIIPASLFIIWQKRNSLSAIESFTRFYEFFPVLFILLFYLLSLLAQIDTFVYLSLVFSIHICVWYVFGHRVYKKLIFPLTFLFFMIPIPAQFYAMATIPLQLFVSKLSALIAQLMNVPIFREGNVIFLPNQTLEVVQACSGLRSLISLFALSTLLAYFTLQSFKLRLVLILSSLPAAIAVNIIRVVIMVIALYYFNTDLTEGTLHIVFGAFIYILALSIIIILGNILSKWDPLY